MLRRVYVLGEQSSIEGLAREAEHTLVGRLLHRRRRYASYIAPHTHNDVLQAYTHTDIRVRLLGLTYINRLGSVAYKNPRSEEYISHRDINFYSIFYESINKHA